MKNETGIAHRWDAGETGCGHLAVGLKRELARLVPGQCLEVTARNEGAPVDVPAWCRVTGHDLLHAGHPKYVIQRKHQ